MLHVLRISKTNLFLVGVLLVSAPSIRYDCNQHWKYHVPVRLYSQQSQSALRSLLSAPLRLRHRTRPLSYKETHLPWSHIIFNDNHRCILEISTTTIMSALLNKIKGRGSSETQETSNSGGEQKFGILPHPAVSQQVSRPHSTVLL
jgi:hypothetical protein